MGDRGNAPTSKTVFALLRLPQLIASPLQVTTEEGEFESDLVVLVVGLVDIWPLVF